MRAFDINNEDSLIVRDNKIVANVGGQELVFDIEAVNKLVVYTTCMGPLHDDMGLIIHISGDTTIEIMSGHECYESFLFDGLGKALPIDYKKIVEASGCTKSKMFVIYKKDSYDFPFADGPHAVCMTCRHVLEEHNPIRFVFHDKDSWQFHCGETHETIDARMVSLDEILHIDDNMKYFANLGYGDYAEMDEETGEWMISHDYYPEDEEYDEDDEYGEDEEYDEDDEDDEPSSEKAHRTASSCESKLEITLEDGEVKVKGALNLGYIGVFEDEQIELDDTLEEIREWDIVTENLDEDCTDEEVIEFLNQYFNSFADRITQNIDNINGTFLLYVFDDMINMETDFREIEELYIEEKNYFASEMDISEIYKATGQALSSLAPYFETPNDGRVPKGHLEAVFRGCFPMFDLDCFIENIEPECIGLSDGEISFQCSDSFDELILCGAYAVIDEDLSFSDWHNMIFKEEKKMGENLEIKSVEAAAEQGDMESQHKLGRMYYDGEGTEVNYEKALYWWEKAAEQGKAAAQYNVGNKYYFGEGTEVNYEKAMYWYEKAAEQGQVYAQFNLGNMYYNGEGTEVNYEKALYWYEKAAKQGDADAQFNLGNMYYNGEGTEVNYEKALYWYEKAAEQGDADAQFETADMYYCSYGEGMSWDKEKALYWFEKAAEQGHIKAQLKTGCMYYKGEGTKRNKEKALYWWEQAAAQGHERAQEYIKANSNNTQKTSVKNLSNTVELKDFSESDDENEYDACANLWDKNLYISVTADILPLEDMIPIINDMLKGLDSQKEAFFNDLVDSYIPYAEDWVLNLCEESEEDSTDEKRCFITEDYNEIYLPISKEDFLDSLNLSIYVSYDKDESDILVDGYINCEPDYFAGHSIEFIVDGKGNFEIEGLAG